MGALHTVRFKRIVVDHTVEVVRYLDLYNILGEEGWKVCSTTKVRHTLSLAREPMQ